MSHWILPININNENDVISWFNETGSIYYRITKSCKNLQSGDIVYIFETFAYKTIVAKGVVSKTNLRWGEFVHDPRFDVAKLSESDRASSKFAKIDLIYFVNNSIITKSYLKNLGVTNRYYVQKNNWNFSELESVLVGPKTTKGKNMFDVFGEFAPNIFYLKEIVNFTGIDGKDYFTTRAKYSLSDNKPYPHICNSDKSLVLKGAQKKIVEGKLKSLGINTREFSNTKKAYFKINIHKMIKMLEKAIGTTSNFVRKQVAKTEFIDFLTKDFHQSSYKYSFLISLLTNANCEGQASIKKVVQSFSDFYVERIELGLMPEKYETQLKQSIEYWSNFNKMKSLIFEPELSYSSFNRRGFVFKDDEKDLIYFNKDIWDSLSDSDIKNIIIDQTNKRNIYFDSPDFKKHNPHSDESINEDIQEIQDDNSIPLTEKEVYVKARVGQGKYRKELLELFKNKCAVTNLDLLNLLVASHIRPWRSSNNAEKIDKYNGLLLSSNIDKLFDAGLITFDDNGIMIISSVLNENQRKILQLEKYNKLIIPLNDKQKEYLKYHRSVIFIK